MLKKLMILFVVLLTSFSATAPVFAQSSAAPASGAVYVMTNAPAGNQVIAYNRAADGSLSYVGTFATGGLGSGVGVTVPPDPLGSQNSLILSSNGKWLFAVNAGSNEISVFKTSPNGLVLTDKVSSYGSYPVSLSYYEDFLYVLNAAGDGNITGFSVDDGHLVHQNNTTRSLNAATPADGSQPQILESPAQVGFSPDGRFLVVTDKGGVSGQGRILTFALSGNYAPAAQPVITTTQTPVPFSFTFDRYGHVVVLDAAVSTVTTYAISGKGSLSVLNTVATGQAATCWIVYNGSYLFTDNTGAGTVSSLAVAPNGSLTLLNPVAGITGPGTLPLDAAISHDGQFLYSLETGAGMVGMFQAQPDGSLVSLGSISGLPALGGAQGIAAR